MEHYKGQSRYGPCEFYLDKETKTWVLICKNKFRQQRRLRPLVLDNMKKPPQVVMNLLANPPIMTQAVEHKEWTNSEYKSICKAVHNQQFPLDDPCGIATGYTQTYLNTDPSETTAKLEDSGLIVTSPFNNEGDLVWAYWTAEGETGGFTGFYKADLVISVENKRVDCRNNLAFWASME